MGQFKQFWTKLSDNIASYFMHQESEAVAKASQDFASKTRLLSPEEDIRRQLNTVQTLDAIWRFVLKRVCTGSEVELVLFSIVDHYAEMVRLRYIYPTSGDVSQQTIHGEFIPFCDRENHLVRTVLRNDTTFTNNLSELGQEVIPYLSADHQRYHVFSIPLVAGGKTIAIISLGFSDVDNFAQAKLSSVYMLRDQLSQVTWNLILLEQLETTPPLDNLTQLPNLARFESIANRELRKAQFENYPLSMALIDIWQLKNYNEQYSPQIGDLALLRLVTIINHHIRGIDTAFRYAGDKILILMPEYNLQMLNNVIKTIMTELETPYKNTPSFKISVSTVNYPADGKTLAQLQSKLESILQFAKYQTQETQISNLCDATKIETVSEQEQLKVIEQHVGHYSRHHEGSMLYEALIQHLHNKPADSKLPLEKGLAIAVENIAGIFQTIALKVPQFIQQSTQSAYYAYALASAIELPALQIEKIRLAALLQNIGYIALPDKLFTDPRILPISALGDMRHHPMLAIDTVLKPYPVFSEILSLIEFHHECWDGSGYPIGLRGDSIPVGARIIAIADAFSAMTIDKPYREALTVKDALDKIKTSAGQQWDPILVELFCKLVHLTTFSDSESQTLFASA